MYRWVFDALDEMGTECPGESLVPPGDRLRLFVTATDFRGRPRGFVIGDPATGREKEHRVVFDLTFERQAGGAGPAAPDDPFGREDNPLLAFAARSTSSFPGAFPPINLADMRRNLCDAGAIADGTCPVPDDYLEGLRDRVFPQYRLDGSEVDDSWFVDGGVLDNYPFGHVIGDLASRAPAREVDRRLVYFQPDPADPPGPPDPEELRFLETIWGALSTIVSSEPTGDDFGEIEDFNSRVRLASGIIDRVREDQARDLDQLMDLRSKEPIDAARARNAVDARLRDDAGLPYAAYLELRTLAVVQQLERNATRACRLEESIQRSLLTAAVRRWAEESSLVGRDADAYAQEWLRERLDVGYLWRQLRFVGESVNRLYDDLEADDDPFRAELDEAQAALAERTEETRELMRGEDLSDAMKAEVGALCAAALGQNDVGRGFDAAVRRFVDDHQDTLDALYAAATSHVGDRQETIRDELQADYDRITADWPEEWRLSVYRDYLGFALWDLVLYPYQRLTDAGEFQEIRVVRLAPDDARALGIGRAKDKLGGASLGHFGAFFERKRREKDYLWGRLDGAERILSLLYGLREEESEDAVAPVPPERLRTAFLGVVAQERQALPLAGDCMDAIEARLAQEGALGGGEAVIPLACRAD
jgi:patatin-related protein